MPAILNEIVENKRRELVVRKTERGPEFLQRSQTPGNNGFASVLQGTSKVRMICEYKPKSPSAGTLNAAPDLKQILEAYNKVASAISVLTDEKYFGGSLNLLKEVSERSPLPTLCKDFVVDSFQCLEAREAGAQAVLLIVKILNDQELASLHQTITGLGMTPVVEVQTEKELERALNLQPQVILINNRNLETFEIDFETTKKLAPKIPSSCIKISASGISEKSDIERLLPYCSNFLIGSSLMSAGNIAYKLEELAVAK
jgi:indole-3-glycerol phosphate synthase/phosphoribosylanthranilate isomerase